LPYHYLNREPHHEEHLNRTELVFDRSILFASSVFVPNGVAVLLMPVNAGQQEL
jgi:hypothetical protein